MKKTSKAIGKKPAAKKPAAKKSPAKPKRKAEGQSELAQIVDRLEAIMDKLTEALEHLAELTARLPGAEARQEHAPQPPMPPEFTARPARELNDEHEDDLEGTSEIREEYEGERREEE